MNRPKSFYRNMTPERAAEIKRLYFAKPRKHTQKQLGEMYGLTQHSVSRIISEQVWSRP